MKYAGFSRSVVRLYLGSSCRSRSNILPPEASQYNTFPREYTSLLVVTSSALPSASSGGM